MDIKEIIRSILKDYANEVEVQMEEYIRREIDIEELTRSIMPSQSELADMIIEEFYDLYS